MKIVEPHLTITKDADPTSAGPGDPVSFTVVLGNDGTSTAHQLVVSDQVPAELFAAGSSPLITSVSLDGVPHLKSYAIDPPDLGAYRALTEIGA